MYNEELYIELENRMFLKKLDSKDLLHPNFKSLISQKIFEEREPFKFGKVTPPFPHNIEIEKDSITFDTNIFFDSKKYEINKAILREIYISIKFLVEEIKFESEFDLNEIEFDLSARISKTEKIKYLGDLNKDLHSEVQEEVGKYHLFIGKANYESASSWEEYVLHHLQHEVLLIEKYLTIDFQINDIPQELFNDWLKYLRVKYLTDFCLSKIAEIENPNNAKQSNIDLSFQISMLEEIRNIKDWDSVSSTKKGKLISNLLGKNKDNIKEIYLKFAKPKSQIEEKILKDRDKASDIIKKILG